MTAPQHRSLSALLAAAGLLAACGRVLPGADEGGPAADLRASASGLAATAVSWTVQESAAGGTVDATGRYTAPAAAGTYHVVVKSQLDPTKQATATVTVAATVVAVTVAPGAVSVQPGGTAQFSATVTGSSDGAVAWTVMEGAAGGGVSSTGLYTAPSSAGTYHVVATSHADGTTTGSGVVRVGAGLAAMPRITVPASKVFGSSGGTGTFARLVDEAYRKSGSGDPGAWTPAGASWWAAVNIGAGPSQVLLSWADEDSGDGDFTGSYNKVLFQSYRIQTCASSPDDGVSCSDPGGWTTAVTVTGNAYASRLQLVPFAGKVWLKMVNTAGTGTIGELELWDASASGASDTFFLHGDSITNICSKRGDDNNTPLVPNWTFQDVAAQLTSGASAWKPSTAYVVNASVANVGRVYRCTTAGTSGGGGVYNGGSGPHGVGTAIADGTARWSWVSDAGHWPQVTEGGNIGHSSADAVSEVKAWLPAFTASNVWVNLMAANDLCGTSPATFQANLQKWIDAVKAAGHIPALIHPTWSQSSSYCPQNIPSFNTVVDRLVANNGLPPAVPLYEATLNHPEYLNSGDVHLTHAGCVAWQATIAQWAATNFYLR